MLESFVGSPEAFEESLVDLQLWMLLQVTSFIGS